MAFFNINNLKLRLGLTELVLLIISIITYIISNWKYPFSSLKLNLVRNVIFYVASA